MLSKTGHHLSPALGVLNMGALADISMATPGSGRVCSLSCFPSNPRSTLGFRDRPNDAGKWSYLAATRSRGYGDRDRGDGLTTGH
ncbi:hypothetical protein MAPG_00367 [Magnaporthiopsis poae ATCC 64411]|uniref:Uncharacterized protein n=1 Tax=Magnaporthiopsis poae (strain ATCC 64411 / 73-15) TaxID=644358 RepID=A0A0C4DKT7_MAGP6|nr:hypothetical protein MAPG_00367 [Magnaporthiopsis poae ATCC 64411]